jgi:hypothetical protein
LNRIVKVVSLFLWVGVLSGCQPSNYEVEILKFDAESYGYQINYKGKLFIKQEFIPAILCKKHFQSEANARAIADWMVEKMQKRESPSINKEVLIALGIDTNCVALPVKQHPISD